MFRFAEGDCVLERVFVVNQKELEVKGYEEILTPTLVPTRTYDRNIIGRRSLLSVRQLRPERLSAATTVVMVSSAVGIFNQEKETEYY